MIRKVGCSGKYAKLEVERIYDRNSGTFVVNSFWEI